MATSNPMLFNGLRSGSGSAAVCNQFNFGDYILVSNLGFTGTHSVKIKGTWSRQINGVVVTSDKNNNAEYDFGDVENFDTLKIYNSEWNNCKPVLY